MFQKLGNFSQLLFQGKPGASRHWLEKKKKIQYLTFFINPSNSLVSVFETMTSECRDLFLTQ